MVQARGSEPSPAAQGPVIAAPDGRSGRARTGRVIVVAGPDGSGKSTVADGLVAAIGEVVPTHRYHHRFRVLPSSAVSRLPTERPHEHPPYGSLVSLGKLLYLFTDHLLGWWLTVRPAVRSGDWVVIERGWDDLAIDPRRYRLRGVARAARLLGRLLPRPDVTLILLAPSNVIGARKSELPPAELSRQLRLWQRQAGIDPGARVVDVTGPLEAVVASSLEAVSWPPAEPGRLEPGAAPSVASGSIALPPRRRARWIIPARPGRAAATGLRLYQPVTLRSLAAWQGARVAARSGLLTSLPGAAYPPLPERLAEWLPSGGSVAVGLGNAGHTAVVMLLDRSGGATAIAKVALDDIGLLRLSHETEALRRLGPRLEAPLAAPTIIDATADMLLMEPIHWQTRLRAWHLPVPVAAAMGRFHRADPGSAPGLSDAGPGHGDFAPWNVFRVGDRWFLLDWEDATERAPDFEDPFHFIVQAHALLGRPSRRDVLAGLDGDGWVGRAIDAYADGAGLSTDGLTERFVSYLRWSLAVQHPERADGIRGIRARRRLLADLGRHDEPGPAPT
jgi:thymidylate kinase